MNLYDLGDTVRLAAAFTNAAGAAADPTAITFYLVEPDGVETSYVYPAAQVVKDSTGNFHIDWTTAKPGRHQWRWKGTGAVAAADTGAFFVEGTVLA